MMERLLKNTHFRFGAPLLVLVIGSSYALKEFSQIRYDIQAEKRVMTKTKELNAMLGVAEEKTSLEEEYDKLKKNLNIDDWKNIRGPRPWETDDTSFKDLIEKRAEEAKAGWIFKK